MRAALGDLRSAGLPRSLGEVRARVRLPLRVVVGVVIALYVAILLDGWLAFALAGDPGIVETAPSPAIPGGETVVRLQPWGAAFRAGIRVGDVISGLDGAPIGDELEAMPATYDLTPGRIVALQVARAPAEDARAVQNVAVILQSRLWRFDLVVEVLVQTLVATLFFALGVVVFLARPDDPAARLFFLAAAGFGLSQAGAIWQYGVHASWVGGLEAWPFRFAVAATLHLFLAFPRPHPTLTWLRSLGPGPIRRARLGTAFLYLIPLGVRLRLEAGPPGSLNWWPPFLALQLILAIFALARSYRRERSPAVHAQLLWMTWAVAIGVTAFVLWEVVGILPRTFMLLAVACVPVAIGFAILRHHLFEIDVVINRTLVYGSLSGSLALVYFGSVYLIQSALRLFTQVQSDLALVLATVAIAFLFDPIRQVIQGTIDRRFYRRHYDAANILAAFGATVRDEVDLNRLASQLCDVVDEAMSPTHVSLWLHNQASGRDQAT